MRCTPVRSLALLATALFSTGCASVLLPSRDTLKVVTDPPGATASAGDVSVVTPGALKIPRRKEPVVVRVEKEGFVPREVRIGWSRSGVAWANVAGVGIGALGTLSTTVCTGYWGRDDSHCTADATALLVGAAVTAAGLALDLSSSKNYSLERDDLVLRLEPVRLHEAQEGASR
jgi:hypothetical protein